MKFPKSAKLFAALCAVGLALDAHAIPLLQLDIAGGSYVGGAEESTVAAGPAFTLYAYLTPQKNDTQAISDTYYVSAAVIPTYSGTAPIGSFALNGTTYNVPTNLSYGVAPFDVDGHTHDGGDLPQHGIYPTYFLQLPFSFMGAQQSSPFDVEAVNGVHGGPVAGTGMYYVPFSVDVSGLNPAYALHFDLYSTEISRNGDVDVNKFAPFSHDARSGNGGGGGQVPVPATALLVGLGLLACARSTRASLKR